VLSNHLLTETAFREACFIKDLIDVVKHLAATSSASTGALPAPPVVTQDGTSSSPPLTEPVCLSLMKASTTTNATMGSQPSYSLPAEQASFSGFLFDMDGTIIDSTPAIVKHWHTLVRSSQGCPPSPLTRASIGKDIGVDPETILQTSHGRRSIDVLKILAPEKANWECA